MKKVNQHRILIKVTTAIFILIIFGIYFQPTIQIEEKNIIGVWQGNLNKNYQYGNYNDKDFYYFTGFSISYIFYKIPCPRNSAPKNSIY
mgnify:CR=1 FL=1